MLVVLAGVMLLPACAFGQDEEEKNTFPLDNFYAKIKKRPRSILKNIKFSASTGYGNTFFSHDLDGFGIEAPLAGAPSIFVASSTSTSYSNWLNQKTLNTTTPAGGGFLVSSDTTKLGFSGGSLNIPLKATIHLELKGKYRIGGGYSYEFMSIGTLSPTYFADRIGDFQPANASGFMSKYFGLVGVSFYRIDTYLFTGDIQVGGFNPGSNFDSSLITKGICKRWGDHREGIVGISSPFCSAFL